jgi:hypothetical protein
MPVQPRPDQVGRLGAVRAFDREAQSWRQPFTLGDGEDELPVDRPRRQWRVVRVSPANAVQDEAGLGVQAGTGWRSIEAGITGDPATCAATRACSQLAGDGPNRSPPSSRAWPGHRPQNRDAAQLEQVCRSRIRMERTRSISGERCQISANGSSRTLPQAIGIATHGITSP